MKAVRSENRLTVSFTDKEADLFGTLLFDYKALYDFGGADKTQCWKDIYKFTVRLLNLIDETKE